MLVRNRAGQFTESFDETFGNEGNEGATPSPHAIAFPTRSGTISRTTPKGRTMAITASEARKNLFPLIEQVNEDRTPVEITSKRGDAVLIGIDDYRALEETAYLLRSPANVRRLLESLEQARAGKVQQRRLDR